MNNDLQGKPRLLRKPPWLKVRPPIAPECRKMKTTLADLKLHTICQEAACPNIAECFACGTATFLLLGNICTRHCLYCNVEHGIPRPPDDAATEYLISAVQKMHLKYVVLTSVTRDDLPDGGAGIFARSIEALRVAVPGCQIEVLIPDFQGGEAALAKVIAAGPDVVNHNMETVPSLFSRLRPQGNYTVSLQLLQRVAASALVSKSGFMVGLGEDRDDILHLMDDLADVSCERLTIGQYQQPTLKHWPVARYYHPDEFAEIKSIARQKGIRYVEAGPLVRSSYHAAQAGL
jgi:lipoic acid synthetase